MKNPNILRKQTVVFLLFCQHSASDLAFDEAARQLKFTADDSDAVFDDLLTMGIVDG